METKLYIRDGKRFKYVPNMLGMYWNGIILTKEKMQDSIAVVIEQHYDHVVMASLTTTKHLVNWHKAKIWCENSFDGKGRLPSNTELFNLKKHILLDIPYYAYVWGEEYSDNPYCAWHLIWHLNELDYYIKNSHYHPHSQGIFFGIAIAVTDVPILNLI